MAQRSKLSGAALAAELSDLSFPQTALVTASPTAELVVEAPAPIPVPQPPVLEAAVEIPQSTTSRVKRTGASIPRGGRPAKAGVDGIPLNVRLSQADHLALAKLAGKLMVPGRPLPTVQDVVRTLIRGALKEPEVAFRLSNRAD